MPPKLQPKEALGMSSRSQEQALQVTEAGLDLALPGRGVMQAGSMRAGDQVLSLVTHQSSAGRKDA